MIPKDHELLTFSESIAGLAGKCFDNGSILITGGLGLIGLNILRYLSFLRNEFNLEFQITLVASTTSHSFLADLFGKDFTILAGDVTSMEFLRTIPKHDFVFHAAGYGQPGRFMSTPSRTMLINSFSLLELRRKAERSFLFASTSEVYSGLNQEGITESEIGNTTPSHPRAMYIESKRFGEAATLIQEPNLCASSSIARIALAYGPGARLDDQRLINQLILRGLDEGIVYINGGGGKIRTYGYVEDVVEQLICLLVSDQRGIFNVGGQSRVSIVELAQWIAEALGVPFVDKVQNEESSLEQSPDSVSLDLTRITKLMGNSEFIGLREGLNATIQWYKFLRSLNR